MDQKVGWWPSPAYKVPFTVKDGDRILIELDGKKRTITFHNVRRKKLATIRNIPVTHYKFICSLGWRNKQAVRFL